MHNIEMHEVSREFARCWQAAGLHIQTRVQGPMHRLLSIAEGCNGHACIMPMRFRAGDWSADAPGWGLVNSRTRKAVDPIVLVSDERIEMTDWELQDFAVQIVRDHLDKAGKKLMSWQGNPAVDPSMWFVGDSGPEWAVVRAVRYPTLKANSPANWQKITAECARLGKVGYFASVSVANAVDAFDSSGAQNRSSDNPPPAKVPSRNETEPKQP